MPRKTRTANVPPMQLPNAPLAEVVFELRWTLPGPGELPIPLRSDPGFWLLLESFTRAARDSGFRVHRDLAPVGQVPGWSIFRRYYLARDKNYPLLQIGPGIFAVNQSTEYDWVSFKHLASLGLRHLLNSYPMTKSFPFLPVHVELRYIDLFDKELIGSADFLRFVNEATSMKIEVPKFLTQDIGLGELSGRILFSASLRGNRDTTLFIDLGDAKRDTEQIMRLESKVISTARGAPAYRTTVAFIKAMETWLENAHKLTSPFFRTFVKPDIMQKFS
jgi:hypothetical protein